MVGRVLQQNSERRDRQMFPAWPFSLMQTVPYRHIQLQLGLVPDCLTTSLLRSHFAFLREGNTNESNLFYGHLDWVL